MIRLRMCCEPIEGGYIPVITPLRTTAHTPAGVKARSNRTPSARQPVEIRGDGVRVAVTTQVR